MMRYAAAVLMVALVLALVLVLAGMPGAASPEGASSSKGVYAPTSADAAPPTYILPLDGVFGGGIASFKEQGVTTRWDPVTTWNLASLSASEQFFEPSAEVLRNQADPLGDFILLAHGECVSTGGCFGFAEWVSY